MVATNAAAATLWLWVQEVAGRMEKEEKERRSESGVQ
jgi:hypothetical protein